MHEFSTIFNTPTPDERLTPRGIKHGGLKGLNHYITLIMISAAVVALGATFTGPLSVADALYLTAGGAIAMIGGLFYWLRVPWALLSSGSLLIIAALLMGSIAIAASHSLG